MDAHYHQHPMVGQQQANEDEAMGGVEQNITTPPIGGYNNFQDSPRRPSAPSDNYPPNGSFSPGMDSDSNSRYPSNNSGYQQPQQYSNSRPGSGLSGGYGHPAYQDQSQRVAHQDQRTQNNVVIKVGMVGDAQIGKTSLMVKYVEGSWDEDYIQTLGK